MMSNPDAFETEYVGFGEQPDHEKAVALHEALFELLGNEEESSTNRQDWSTSMGGSSFGVEQVAVNEDGSLTVSNGVSFGSISNHDDLFALADQIREFCSAMVRADWTRQPDLHEDGTLHVLFMKRVELESLRSELEAVGDISKQTLDKVSAIMERVKEYDKNMS